MGSCAACLTAIKDCGGLRTMTDCGMHRLLCQLESDSLSAWISMPCSTCKWGRSCAARTGQWQTGRRRHRRCLDGAALLIIVPRVCHCWWQRTYRRRGNPELWLAGLLPSLPTWQPGVSYPFFRLLLVIMEPRLSGNPGQSGHEVLINGQGVSMA